MGRDVLGAIKKLVLVGKLCIVETRDRAEVTLVQRLKGSVNKVGITVLNSPRQGVGLELLRFSSA
jgi:hypothetical protein